MNVEKRKELAQHIAESLFCYIDELDNKAGEAAQVEQDKAYYQQYWIQAATRIIWRALREGDPEVFCVDVDKYMELAHKYNELVDRYVDLKVRSRGKEFN